MLASLRKAVVGEQQTGIGTIPQAILEVDKCCDLTFCLIKRSFIFFFNRYPQKNAGFQR